MQPNTNTDSIWKNKPETIRRFIEQRQDYEQLCAEIAYTLKKRISAANIEISSVTNRAKTLNSFLEKIDRKDYTDPFTDITDFAGVRVVYLYQQDLSKIETLIENEFIIIEKVDKLNDKGAEKFGYGAIHYIVKLGKKSSGARYDDLKNLSCEIQVKTVLQDAWAIIDHHLIYKRESEIPSKLQRKLNSLAGLFETADNQFENIRQEREKYLKAVEKSIGSNEFLSNELNLDTFNAYLKWKFPEKEISYFDSQPEIILKSISQLNFKTLSEIDIVLEKYKKHISKISEDFENEYGIRIMNGNKLSSSLIVSLILGIDNEEYRKKTVHENEILEFLDRYRL